LSGGPNFAPKTNFMRCRLFFAVAGIAAAATVSSCRKEPGGPAADIAGKLVYVLSNDYHDNANAVLGYRQRADGTLTPLPGSPFHTGGAGLGNPAGVLGPDDTDDPLIISPDGRWLLAVNGGSNTIAVFGIERDGSLTPVAGSPFPSGGQTPCSIAINGRYVYVANKSFDPLHTITQLPNYIAFTLDGAGHLEEVAGSKVEEPAGSSPSQVLVSGDHRFLFATDFLAFMLTTETPTGTLLSFDIQASGALKSSPGSPYVLPAGDGGALGLAENPHSPVLYVGFPVASAVGAYSIDPLTGELTLKSTVGAGAAACWLKTDAEGHRLYVLNSGENSVGVYDIGAAASPVFISKLVLKDSGPYMNSKGGTSLSSGDFGLGFSANGTTLYVECQDVNPNPTAGNFNFLHVLKVAADGTVSEPGEPLQLPVASDVRPQGVATR
jgi:DNA-binding beta-propeller fold protein YncE